MNKHPIESARDADLRLSQQAIQRAALSARKVAAITGTVLVVSHHGVIEQISPDGKSVECQVHEPYRPYGDKR